MKEDKIPCPECGTIMIGDIHTPEDIPSFSIEQLKAIDNWWCPKCEQIYHRDDLPKKVFK